MEPLEDRRLLAVTPSVTLDAPGTALLGEEFDFSVVFDNLGNSGEVGY